MARQKFISYVTVLNKDGIPQPKLSITNYKVIYIFTDRIAFYSSSASGDATLEPEDTVTKIPKIEAKIERVINFGEIILDLWKISQ